MSENHNKNLSDLHQKRHEIIERVRQKMPSEAAALDALNMVIEIAQDSQIPALPYSGVRRGIDAVVMHLNNIREPMERGRLISEVLAAGWRKGDPHAYAKLWDVIRYHCDVAKNSPIVRQKGDTVALARAVNKKG